MKLRKRYNNIRARRTFRVRSKIGKGTSVVPRLSVFRSNKHIAAQIIDDEQQKTLLSVSSRNMKVKGLPAGRHGTKKEIAREVGKMLGEKAKKASIVRALVDRGSYRYHGRVKELIEGAQEMGLQI